MLLQTAEEMSLVHYVSSKTLRGAELKLWIVKTRSLASL